jgi:hypothetical protein
MQKFCIWDLLIFCRDSIAPSLKVIYESWACGKSRNSATKVKLPFKKAPETTPALRITNNN